jgi:hypothetical protein
MASQTTERVKRHRLARGVVRVEVEVPNAEDALAVRRFAQSRREAARGQMTSARTDLTEAEAPQVSLETVLGQLSPTGRIVVERFAKALMRAPMQAVINRAAGMAAILEDAAIRASSVGNDRQRGEGPIGRQSRTRP